MRNRVLRQIAGAVGVDPPGVRDQIEQALRDARGPLIQAVEGDPQKALVTFVCTGSAERPVLGCLLIPGRDGRCGMQLVPGTTDTWYAEAVAPIDACVSYHFEPGSATIPMDSKSPLEHPEEFIALCRDRYDASIADPYNPERCFPMTFAGGYGSHAGMPPSFGKWDSILALPEAEKYRWHAEPERRGRSHGHTVRSAALRNTRRVTVWSPPEVTAGDGPLPVVVLLDGEAFRLGMRAERIFDNLVGGGHVRPFVAVLVDNATVTSRMSEYACNPMLTEFLADELLPELRSAYPLTDQPADTIIGGFSLGGLAADWLGFSRAEVFGNVLSMSAALWWASNSGGDDQDERLTRQYLGTATRALRFWIDVGSLEVTPLPFTRGLSMVSVSRRFRDALIAKGYEVAGYREQSGAHDYANWRRTLPLGLVALLGRVLWIFVAGSCRSVGCLIA